MIKRIVKLLTSQSFERAFGIILVALSVASVLFVGVQTVRLGDVTECQAAYNEAYSKAIHARSDAARNERKAQRELWTTVLNQQIPVEEKRAAFVKYLETLDEADRVRDRAQIPTRRC